jgi:hypothetical protein
VNGSDGTRTRDLRRDSWAARVAVVRRESHLVASKGAAVSGQATSTFPLVATAVFHIRSNRGPSGGVSNLVAAVSARGYSPTRWLASLLLFDGFLRSKPLGLLSNFPADVVRNLGIHTDKRHGIFG